MPHKIILMVFIVPLHFLLADSARDIILKLLKGHPELRSVEEEYKKVRADAEHSATYPDPKIGFSYKNYPYGSINPGRPDLPGMAGKEVMISQEIPFPGKLTKEKNAKKLNAEEYKHLLNSYRNSFIRDLAERQIKMSILQNKIKHYESMQKVYSSLSKISGSNYSAGKTSILSTLESKISISEVGDELIKNRTEYDEILESLHYYEQEPVVFVDDILKADFKSYLDTKRSELVSGVQNLATNNQNYKLQVKSIQKAQAEEKLNDVLHYPDVEVFFAYMKRHNKQFMVDTGPLDYRIMDRTEYMGDLMSFGVTVRVPVWSFFTDSDLKEKSKSEIKANFFKAEKVKKEIEAKLKSTIASLKGTEERLKHYNSVLLPDLERAVNGSKAEYSSGKIGLVSILFSQVQLIKAKIVREELTEKRYSLISQLLELTDTIVPNN
ncbi:MAG: TolC family protein [Leptospiraceae bacterium]|nr:TolC family protein [Leptospiraceae bacterium]